MIDQYGNKINSGNNIEADPKFTLSELQFMMKGFRKNSSVHSAMMIAKKLTQITKNEDILICIEDEISAIIEELEAFAATSGDSNLCWELVYSLRSLSLYNHKLSIMGYSSRYKRRSASLFEYICEFTPTEYNKCCKILEYSAYVLIQFGSDKDSEFNKTACLDVLLKQEKDFKLLTDRSAVYFKTGRNLYRYMFIIYSSLNNEKKTRNAAYETAYYSREYYLADKSDELLQQYLTDYLKYAGLPTYLYPQNTEQFNEAMKWAEELVKRADNKTNASILNRFRSLNNTFNQN